VKRWSEMELAAVAEIQGGIQKGKKRKPGTELKTVPYLRVANVQQGYLDLTEVKEIKATEAEIEKLRLVAGDVLMNEGGDPDKLGRGWVWQDELPLCIHQNHVFRVRPNEEILDPFFLTYFANSETKKFFQSNAKQTTGIASISKKQLSKFPIQVPPLNEQRRIVAKIENLTARSRAAKQALDAIPPLLERFRQSVLAAAFRGDLTKQWRHQNPNTEPATELLKRIRQERRQRWEQDYLEKQKAKGKQPKNDKWKEKYKEPEPVDTRGLPELPEGWCWGHLPEMGEMSRGKSKHRPRNDPSLYSKEGMPFVQTGEVANSGGRITGATKFYGERGVAQSRVFPEGTVCITIAANIANSAILALDACFPDSVVGVVCCDGLVCPDYLEYFIRTARASLEMYAPATAQKNINLAILSQVAVPIPPAEERQAIVQILDEAFESIDRLAAAEAAGAKQLSRLNQSILAKAFRGELVSQDPNVEPASTLIERIRAEREAAQSKKKSKKAQK
jgi:type I restriction enzyme, S subunit